MEYLAHISEDHRQQTILQHLKGAAELCGCFAASFGAEEPGKSIGLAHGIGKCSDAFRRRLHGEGRVDYATAGACECFRQGQSAAAFCVSGHQDGLPDGNGRGDRSDLSTFWGRIHQAGEGKPERYISGGPFTFCVDGAGHWRFHESHLETKDWLRCKNHKSNFAEEL